MTDFVELRYSPDLTLVLNALGIHWREGHPSNGSHGTIVVLMDDQADGRLEDLINSLSDLRWRYEPGRTLQLQMELTGV